MQNDSCSSAQCKSICSAQLKMSYIYLNIFRNIFDHDKTEVCFLSNTLKQKTLNPAAAIIPFRSDLHHTCVPLDSQAGAKTAADF